MINNLKDFKNSSKRIQSILQTFEIKTSDAFKLSNSASLNFMARILGYENYNTIKSVLGKNISKGNSMFIEINKHTGVTSQSFHESKWHENFNDNLIGLNQVVNIEFRNDNNEKIISFTFPSDMQWVEYKFAKAGMGEYHKIKRILEQNIAIETAS